MTVQDWGIRCDEFYPHYPVAGRSMRPSILVSVAPNAGSYGHLCAPCAVNPPDGEYGFVQGQIASLDMTDTMRSNGGAGWLRFVLPSFPAAFAAFRPTTKQ